MADEKKLDKKEIEELRKLFKMLGKEISDVSFHNLTQSAEAARELLRSMKDEVEKLKTGVDGAVTSFKEIAAEIKKSKEGINQTVKGFNAISNLALKIQYHQQKISKLTEDELDDISIKLSKERLRLANANVLLEKDKKFLELGKLSLEQQIKENQEDIKALAINTNKSEAEKKRLLELVKEKSKLNKLYSENNIQLDETEAALKANKGIVEETDKEWNNIQKAIIQINKELADQRELMGLAGSSMAALDTVMNKFGLSSLNAALGIKDAHTAMVDTADAIREAGGDVTSLKNKFTVLNSGIQMMGKALTKHLSDPAVITTFLVKEMIDALLSADEATGKLAKNTDLTYTEALQAREEFQRIANLSMDSVVNTRGLQESYEAISTSLGAQADINEKDLVTMTKLREQAGFTNEELTGMYKMSLVTGKSVEDTAEEFMAGATALKMQKGLSINVKQLMKESATVSNSIKLSLGGSAESLAKAMVSAKALGVNLEKVDGIANSLLQFEESISAELEAELLTGQDIYLERARLAALNNDFATVAEEINEQLGGSAEFTKMNRIQQEAMAKAVGMTREDLANSLTEQEALQRVGAKTAEAAREKYDALVKQYGVEKAQKMLGDEALANQFQQQSIQEQYSNSVEKLREIFVGLAQPILEMVKPIVDLVTTLLPAVNFLLSPLIEGFTLIGNLVTGFVNGLKEGQPVMVAVAGILTAMLAPTIMTAIFSIFSSLAQIPMGLGLPLAAVAVAGMISLANKSASDVKKVKDGAIDSNGGLVVSKPEGGIVAQGIKDDNVVFTTNDVKPGGGKSPSGGGGDNSGMAAELAAIKNILQQIANTPGIVQINGTEAGRILAPLINQSNLQTQVKTQ